MTVDSRYFIEQYKADGDVKYTFQMESIGADAVEVYSIIAGVRTLIPVIEYIIEFGYRDPINTRGVITLNTPFPDDAVLQVERATPITNDQLFVQGKPFPAEAFEYAIDKLTFILQELEGSLCDCRAAKTKPGYIGDPADPTDPDGPFAPVSPLPCDPYGCSAVVDYVSALQASGLAVMHMPLDEAGNPGTALEFAPGSPPDQSPVGGSGGLFRYYITGGEPWNGPASRVGPWDRQLLNPPNMPPNPYWQCGGNSDTLGLSCQDEIFNQDPGISGSVGQAYDGGVTWGFYMMNHTEFPSGTRISQRRVEVDFETPGLGTGSWTTTIWIDTIGQEIHTRVSSGGTSDTTTPMSNPPDFYFGSSIHIVESARTLIKDEIISGPDGNGDYFHELTFSNTITISINGVIQASHVHEIIDGLVTNGNYSPGTAEPNNVLLFMGRVPLIDLIFADSGLSASALSIAHHRNRTDYAIPPYCTP